MFLFIFFILVGLYFFLFGSLHSLFILLFVEIFILGGLLFLLIGSFSWFFCLLYLLVSVCLGAYGVSVYVSVSRVKGSNYSLSF